MSLLEIKVDAITEEYGQHIYQTNPNFRELMDVMTHPMFVTFVQRHFRSWSHVQVIAYLFRLYETLDELDQHLNPFHKLALLEDLARTGAFQHMENMPLDELERRGKELYRLNRVTHGTSEGQRSDVLDIIVGEDATDAPSIFKDVTELMEHPTLREFIHKYFIRWDMSNMIVILTMIFEYFKRTESNPWKILGRIHFLMTNRETRQSLHDCIQLYTKKLEQLKLE